MQFWFDSLLEGFSSYRRPALFIGHPGHELRVFGWMAENRPRVYVLTDGSGLNGPSRLSATSRLLGRVGGGCGEVFGLFSDAEIYRAILDKEIGIFLSIVDQLARSWVEEGIDFVAADAAEGFNPSHDICRHLANAAVCRVRMLTGRSIANYEFCLTEWDMNGAPTHDSRCRHLRLGNRLLRLKLDAAREYAELSDEVAHALSLKGEEYFRTECLRTVTQSSLHPHDYKPYYEKLGEQRVAAGKYRCAIQYRAHMLPILRAIEVHASEHQGADCDSGLEVKILRSR